MGERSLKKNIYAKQYVHNIIDEVFWASHQRITCIQLFILGEGRHGKQISAMVVSEARYSSVVVKEMLWLSGVTLSSLRTVGSNGCHFEPQYRCMTK